MDILHSPTRPEEGIRPRNNLTIEDFNKIGIDNHLGWVFPTIGGVEALQEKRSS